MCDNHRMTAHLNGLEFIIAHTHTHRDCLLTQVYYDLIMSWNEMKWNGIPVVFVVLSVPYC